MDTRLIIINGNKPSSILGCSSLYINHINNICYNNTNQFGGLSMRVLIVEDDAMIASGLEYAIMQEGIEVIVKSTVTDAMKIVHDPSISLLLLDLSLPDGNGYTICEEAKKKRDVAVIFLTAVDDEGNVVKGLDMGADDYITKPFRIRELISRMKSVMRRYEKKESLESVVSFQNIRIYLNEAKVYKENEEIILTAMEYRLLLTLVQHAGQVLTRNQLLEGIWDVSGEFVNDNTLTVYIKRLREKLEENSGNPTLIKTVRGMGYMLEKGKTHAS